MLNQFLSANGAPASQANWAIKPYIALDGNIGDVLWFVIRYREEHSSKVARKM